MRHAKGNTATTSPPEWWPSGMLDEQPTADLLGVSVLSLRDWRCRKTVDLPFAKVGARVKYNSDDVWKWLAANTVRPMVCA